MLVEVTLVYLHVSQHFHVIDKSGIHFFKQFFFVRIASNLLIKTTIVPNFSCIEWPSHEINP